MKSSISAREHYDRLAEAGHGRNDPPRLQEYMARWDGPLFFEALGDVTGKDVLEVGIGCGRIARQVLALGCRSLTGLDISSKTIAAAESDLGEFANLELINADICEFRRPGSFHIAYSVLTFMHVQDKERALGNLASSLLSGGHLVLSIDHTTDLIDFGEWTVPLHLWPPDRYAEKLGGLGCDVEEPVPLIDGWIQPNGRESDTYGEKIATLIRAIKR